MNFKRLKKFAREARRILGEETRETLRSLLSKGDLTGTAADSFTAGGEPAEKLIGEISSTWFSRVTAIRYMEFHGHLLDGPFRYIERNASSGAALRSDAIAEFERSFSLACQALDRVAPLAFLNDSNLIGRCRPKLERAPGSFLFRFSREVHNEDFANIESVGWMFQFFSAEKMRSGAGRTIKPEKLSTATQLYTPEWIASYMLQNTLGRSLLELAPGNTLTELPYLIPAAPGTGQSCSQSVKNLTFLDPACGCGHLLVQAYDLFRSAYVALGVTPQEAARLILENNLYGLDIDGGAVQIARFALTMKAIRDDPQIFERGCSFAGNVAPVVNSLGLQKILATAESRMSVGEKDLSTLIECFKNAEIYGSLIQLTAPIRSALLRVSDQVERQETPLTQPDSEILAALQPLLTQAALLSREYDVVVTNPPYLGSRFMDGRLKGFLKTHYRGFERDIFAAFMVRNFHFTRSGGLLAFMTPFVWMFISSYSKLRRFVLDQTRICSLVQLHYSGFEDATVPICTFALFKPTSEGAEESAGTYIRLASFSGSEEQSKRTLEAVRDPACPWRFQIDQSTFDRIPGAPFAYWMNEQLRSSFHGRGTIGASVPMGIGLNTGDNARFLRKWWEVDRKRIAFGMRSLEEARRSGQKWFPYNKGGEFRKWAGNYEWVINWENDGAEIKDYAIHRNKGRHWSRYIQNLDLMFREGLTWSFVSSSHFGVRYLPPGFLFDVAGSSMFPTGAERDLLLSLLCSRVGSELVKALNPSLNFQAGNIRALPYLIPSREKLRRELQQISLEAVALSTEDWNSSETSWDFTVPPFLRDGRKQSSVQLSIEHCLTDNMALIQRMAELETANNRALCATLGLAGSIRAEVTPDEITLRNPDSSELVRELLSFSVGVAFGRFPSERGKIDDEAPLLTLSEGGKDLPALHLEQLLATYFGVDCLEKNLAYVAHTISSSTTEDPRLVISRYYRERFFWDHSRRYHKRPIYWLLSSGRERAFQALLYYPALSRAVLGKIVSEKIPRVRQSIVASIGGKATGKGLLAELDAFSEALARVLEDTGPEHELGIASNYNRYSGILARL
jgi:hypothetical protein